MILNQMRRTVAVYNPNRAPLDYSATLYHPLEAIVIPTLCEFKCSEITNTPTGNQRLRRLGVRLR
jgi:hypothetical protein